MTTIANIIATATRSVGAAHRDSSGIGYYAYVPYYNDQPRGPGTEVRSTCRFSMLEKLRGKKAAIALALAAEEFGLGDDFRAETEDLVYRVANPGYYSGGNVSDWRKEVRALVRKHRTIN